jgi:O-antigen/teichoic acid export membrane protein
LRGLLNGIEITLMQNKSNNTIQAFWVGMGRLSLFAIGIVIAAILSRYFDKAEYGTYRQILYVYSTLLVIFSAGLPKVFAYFLPRYPLEQGKHIVWKVSKLLFYFGITFSIALFISSGLIAQILKNPELEIGLKCFSPIPMFLLPTLGIEGIFSTYKKTIYVAIYNIITRILMLLCIVFPVILLNGTYLVAIYGWIAVSVFSLGIAWYFKGIPFKNISFEKEKLPFKEIFSYSLPIVVASLAGIAIKSADQFYISRYFGPEIFAEFSNGFIELPFVAMITGATSTVLMPVFSKIFHQKRDSKELISSWKSALDKSALIIYPLVIFFIAYAKETVILLYSEKYVISSQYFQIKMFLNLFNIVIFAPLFFSMGKTRLYSNVHIGIAIAVWIVDYSLILIFNDPIAIAISSTGFNIFKIFFFIYLASRILKVNYFSFFPVIKLFKYFSHALVIIICVKISFNYFITIESLLLNFLISFIVFSTLLLISSPIIKLNYFEIIQPIINKSKIHQNE